MGISILGLCVVFSNWSYVRGRSLQNFESGSSGRFHLTIFTRETVM